MNYYNDPEKTELLNVISLEFSCSRLAPLIDPPAIVSPSAPPRLTLPHQVRHIDLIEQAWPPALKALQKDESNTMATMKYPKVQRYCLMSVAGCYTDFHIDFGGSSVWYHLLRGQKVFICILCCLGED